MKIDFYDNKTICVTGGTGSFGQKFIKSILKNAKPKKVIVYSRDELKQYNMANDIAFAGNNRLRYFIGDVRDLSRLSLAFKDVDYVVHAAALKQVPAAEYNPMEAIKTNVYGAQNVVDAALERKVSNIIALSTDKASSPVNLYGATKLCSDKLFTAANLLVGSDDIKFSVVRYGNVFGSRGSVVPLFSQISKNNSPFIVTDERMTRFSITLQQGVDFVNKCFSYMKGGEIFVPKIPSYRILDLIKAFSSDPEIKIIGIRPGEKLHESMISVDDSLNTYDFDDYYVISPSNGSLRFETDFKKNELNKGFKGTVDYGFEYNSGKNDRFLTISELKELIIDFQNQNNRIKL